MEQSSNQGEQTSAYCSTQETIKQNQVRLDLTFEFINQYFSDEDILNSWIFISLNFVSKVSFRCTEKILTQLEVDIYHISKPWSEQGEKIPTTQVQVRMMCF